MKSSAVQFFINSKCDECSERLIYEKGKTLAMISEFLMSLPEHIDICECCNGAFLQEIVLNHLFSDWSIGLKMPHAFPKTPIPFRFLLTISTLSYFPWRVAEHCKNIIKDVKNSFTTKRTCVTRIWRNTRAEPDNRKKRIK